MFKMKRLLLSAAMLGSLAANAEVFPYLAFQTSDGTVQAVSVESLTITMSDGKLIATNASGTKTFTLSELSSMYFTSEATAIESIENEKLRNGENEEVYSLSGQKMSNGQMPRGIYVVKQNGKTRKIVVK